MNRLDGGAGKRFATGIFYKPHDLAVVAPCPKALTEKNRLRIAPNKKIVRKHRFINRVNF